MEKKPTRIKRKSQGMEVFKRFCKNPLAVTGAVLFILIYGTCLLAPLIAPYSYEEMIDGAVFAAPSAQHLFGCDRFGRDLFSRMLYGGIYSITMGLVCTVVSSIIGIALGAIAGFFGQIADNIVMRFTDILQAIPGVLLAMVISTVLGPGLVNTMIALSIGGISMNARMLRGLVLQIRSAEFVEAASSINCSKFRIIVKHVIPNTFGPLLVGITMGVGGVIMSSASLSFVGLGVQPPTPEWGALLTEGRNYMTLYPYLLIFPGLAIGLFSLATCFMGDGLRDAMDPRLKK